MSCIDVLARLRELLEIDYEDVVCLVSFNFIGEEDV